MKAVLFAAGKSTRTHPLTFTKPKVMLKIANKPILEHNLDSLKGYVDEVVIIVGFMKNMIMEYLGDEFKEIKLTYVEQKEQLGTGHALLAAKDHVKDRFIVMNGDDIYSEENIRCVLREDLSVLVKKMEDPSRFGVWVVNKGIINGFAEKPKNFVSDLANCGLYVLDEGIFSELAKLKKTERGEYEINEAVNMLAQKEKVHAIESEGYWLPIGYPWDVIDANKFILDGINTSEVLGETESYVTIKGPVRIGKGTVIKSGTYIEGPVVIGEDCVIGPNCFLRPFTSIGNRCRIGSSVEIKNSVIGDGTKISHLSYFGDSVLGDNINIGAGTIAANIRHDRRDIEMFVKGERINTRRRKLGVIIGDSVKTGINTSIYPGRRIWPGKTTLPGEIVKKDIV